MNLEGLYKDIIWKSPIHYKIGLNGGIQLIYDKKDWNIFSQILLKNALNHFDHDIEKVDDSNDDKVFVNTDLPQDEFYELNSN